MFDQQNTEQTEQPPQQPEAPKYKPSMAEISGSQAYKTAMAEGIEFWDVVRNIQISDLAENNMTPQDVMRDWLLGWDRARDEQLCADNPKLAEKLSATQFSEGRVLTIRAVVMDPYQTQNLLRSMYSKEMFTIAGCAVHTVGLIDQMAKYEEMKSDLVEILRKHGVISN